MTQTSDRNAWKPILSGAAANKAWHVIRFVARELENRHEARNYDDPWIALLYAYLALETGEAQFESIANRRLHDAIDGLEHVRGPGLFGGLAGTGWVSAHIDTLANGFVAGGQTDDDYADIDEFLASLSLSSVDCELLAGIAGLAVYWLERLPAKRAGLALEQIVEHLQNSVDHSAGWTWRKSASNVPLHNQHRYPTGQHNLGASHGVPGVVSVLARIASEGIAVEISRRLAENAAGWVLSQGTKINGWAFPPSAGDPPISWLRWCYGPLGIAGTLMVAGYTLDLAALREQSLEVAVACAKRRAELSSVKDPGLCHGAAGIAHVFNRMAQLSGNALLRDAARASYEYVLDLFDPRHELGGFLFWVPPREARRSSSEPPLPEWRGDSTFLEGSAGTALALLAAVSPLAPKWDRVLGLSA